MAKRRPIPPAVAAEVLFRSDRTCCVCRKAGKPVQIHHLDEDPHNNHSANLAVLCLECHRDTQIRGGFDRKLDAEQVRIYRDDWIRHVHRKREVLDIPTSGSLASQESSELQPQLVAALIEAMKEERDLLQLARLHASLGNDNLRDSYINEALSAGVPAWEEVLLRRIQGRIDLVSQETRDRALEDSKDDWTVLSGLYLDFGDPKTAALVLVDGIRNALEDRGGSPFTAAYYMKREFDNLANALLKLELDKFTSENALWWQVRALEELGWESEREALLLAHAEEIAESGDLNLQLALATLRSDAQEIIRLNVAIAHEWAAALRTVDDSDEDA